MMFDDLPPPPAGFELDPVNPPPRAPRLVPVSNAFAIAQGVYPDLQITDWRRDPNSRLGRANPGSWHVRSSAAIDARPIPGMTFDQYVQGFRDAGFQPLEAIDEVHHPSRHATGPHWHVALGYDPNTPPLDPTANMREQSGDAPPDALPPPPTGFALDAPSSPPPPALPGGPGLNGSAPPPDPAMLAAVQSLAPPPSDAPRLADPLAFSRAGVMQQEQATTAAAPPPPTGYVADPNNVASEHSAPASQVPTAQVTTRDDPRLRGLNDQVRSMATDINISNEELTSFLLANGVDRASVPGWDALMAWRAAPASAGPQRSLAAWRQLPARQRGREGVNLDDINLPQGQYREVTTPGNVPQGSITSYTPPLTERVAHALSAPDRMLSSDPRDANAAEHQRAEILQNPLSPVQALQDAQEATGREQQAQLEGRYVDAQGNHLEAGVAMLGVLPFGRGARAGEQVAGKALAEVEALAARYGVRAAGPAADAAIARIATERFGELSPETRSILHEIAQPGEGEAAPTELSALHLGDLRAAANPSPPGIVSRVVQGVRDRFGGRGEPAATEAPAAAADDLPPPPAGFTLETRAPDSPRPNIVGGREVVGELPAEGVAPANVGTDGRLYVGGMGQAHFDVIEQFPDGVWSGETGFVTPDGQFLNRTEALDHVNRNGERIRPSENMHGGPGGDELDALDYRDQSQMVPPPDWSTRRAEWERQAALRRGAALPAHAANLPPPPAGFTLEDPLGRVPPLGEQPTPEAMADAARSIRPEDVVPIPGNRVETAEEAAQANPGTFRDVRAPDPATMLEMRTYQRQGGQDVRLRGPLDAEGFLRLQGGLRDDGGDLRAIGITNNSARPEAPGEAKLGPILNRSGGLTLDQAGEALHEAGYFHERPTTGDVVDMLNESRRGNRLWHNNDLGEVADFHGAQAQRYQADAAAQAGAPLAERVGAPVVHADLHANEPPATAYEDLPRIGGTVGNINLAHIESGADIGRLLNNVEQRFGGFDAARRGVITHAETEALAGELGMTVDDLLRRRPGQALNAEQALAARQLLAKSSDEVIALAAKATGSEASDVSRAAFSEALLRHAAIHEQVTGATAEAGRALSAMRAAARSRAISGTIHQAAADGMGGQKRLEEVAEKILELHQEGVGPGEVNRYAVRATQPRFRDKLVELWYNSLLSGPRTHAVNIMSNLMTAALQIPEHAAAAGLGLVRRGAGALLGKADDFDRVMASEIGERAFGLMQGTGEGLRAFKQAMRTGEAADHVSKVEARTQHAISGLKGSIIRTPTNLLIAEDEFFKGIGRRMELNGLAVRQARAEGLRGQALRDRIADLSANPTDDMVAKAMDYARYVTFQRPLQQGSAAQHLQRMTQNNPWMKLFIPFVRTPANLLKFAVERSPAGLLLKSVRADFMAGGARRDLAVARMMLGTGLSMTVADLASRGIITGGGPADRGALDLMRGDGWQPYSIKINGTYYSYARMDPISTTIGATADMVDFTQHMTASQRAQAGPLLIASMIRNLGNKTWLSGVSDMVDAINDPQRSGASLIARLVASIAVPAIVSQTAGVLDPTMRDTRAPADADPSSDPYGLLSTLRQTGATIQSRLPGVSQNLPARRDVWGQPITREEPVGPGIARQLWRATHGPEESDPVTAGALNFGADIISPFSTSTARNDPITAELLTLGASIGHPAQQIRGVRLTPEQAGSYAEMSGRYIRDDLASAMADPEWHSMTPQERLSQIDSIKRTAREDARADLGLDGSGQSQALPPPPPGFQLAH